MALNVMSSKFPIGVLTMKSVPAISFLFSWENCRKPPSYLDLKKKVYAKNCGSRRMYGDHHGCLGLGLLEKLDSRCQATPTKAQGER